MKTRRFGFFLTIGTFLVAGCSLFAPVEGPLQLIITSDTLNIAWDPPAATPLQPAVVEYNVYYRMHGATDWNSLSSVKSSETPGFSIEHGDLEFGLWEFAVSSIDENGEESGFHTSIDRTAEPFTGWYVFWIGSL
jgi:hypothetical protein